MLLGPGTPARRFLPLLALPALAALSALAAAGWMAKGEAIRLSLAGAAWTNCF